MVIPKYAMPQTSQTTVSRAPLINEIQKDPRPLVSVTAPAGYGKTTLLAEWARSEARTVVWVTLDDADNDPMTLARSIATALAHRALVDVELMDAMVSVDSVLDRGVPGLELAVAALSEPFVMLIDELDRVVDDRAFDLLDVLVSHVPDGSQIALAGRAAAPSIPRRRVRDQIVEVGFEDLMLDHLDTATVFAGMGVEIDAPSAASVVRVTEGWASAVHLSALIAKRSPDSWTSDMPISGRDHFLSEFLLREVFEDLPAPLATFLVESSVLDEMNASLCNDALQMRDAQGFLDELDRMRLFTVPLDRNRGWFRYHQLFRDFLLGELERRDPDSMRRVQGRAASWCRTNGEPDRAIDYLLRAGDAEGLGPLLSAAVRPAYMEGRLATVDRWLEDCGRDTIDQFPGVAVMAGWVSALTAKPIDAQRWAAHVEECSFSGPTGDGFADLDSGAAGLRALLCANGVDAMRADAELTVAREPEWSIWRNTVVWLLGLANELAGDRAAAIERYDEARRLAADGSRTPIVVAPVFRSLLAMDAGDWKTAAVCLREVADTPVARTPGAYLSAALADAANARLALNDGNTAEVTSRLASAMDARSLGTYAIPHASIRLRQTLASVHAGLGDLATARALVAEIDGILARRPALGVLVDEVAELRRRISDDVVGPRLNLSPAERRLIPFLSTHFTFAEIGDQLFISRNTVSTHVGSIYRKLGVSSRAQAVQRARDLGIT